MFRFAVAPITFYRHPLIQDRASEPLRRESLAYCASSRAPEGWVVWWYAVTMPGPADQLSDGSRDIVLLAGGGALMYQEEVRRRVSPDRDDVSRKDRTSEPRRSNWLTYQEEVRRRVSPDRDDVSRKDRTS